MKNGSWITTNLLANNFRGQLNIVVANAATGQLQY